MKKIFFTFIIMMFTMVQSFAQVNETVVIGGKQKGDANAALEVLSKNGTKGMMPPRATTAQITAMESGLTEDSKGLVIYDTDQNCLKTWQGTTWSGCSELAQYTYVSSTLEGNFYEDTPVDGRNFIKVKINVTKPGYVCFATYDYRIGDEDPNPVRVISTPIYIFHTGEQELKLFLAGTVNNTGPQILLTDCYVLDKDGYTSVLEYISINPLPKRIVEVPAEYTFVSAEAVGDYAIGVPVNSRNNYIKLKVNVTKTGLYDIGMPVIKSSETYNDKDLLINTQGIFNTTGEHEVLLSVAGVNNNKDIMVLGLLIFDNYNIQIDSGNESKQFLGTAEIRFNLHNTIERAIYKITDIGPAQGEYYWDVPMDGSNYMIATVNVTKPGVYDIGTIYDGDWSDTDYSNFLAHKDFVKFNSTGAFHVPGVHKVILHARGIAINTNGHVPGYIVVDNYDSNNWNTKERDLAMIISVPFKEKPLKYKTAKCTFSSTSIHGNYVNLKPLDSTHYIKVFVKITEPGLIHFTGQNNIYDVNRVTFDSGLVYFDSVGIHEVILYGKGVFGGTNNDVDIYDVNNSIPVGVSSLASGFVTTASFEVNDPE